MQDFQERLTAVERDLEQLDVFKQRLQADAAALRQQMITMSLATVADLVHGAIQSAILFHPAPAIKQQLRMIQQQVMEPSEASRMAAYDALRVLHLECPHCAPKVTCPIGRALIVSRDLLVLTISIGKGPMTHQILKDALEDALRSGCHHHHHHH